ncbi:MAG: hypothetical protein B7X93_02815 [Hydrogenophilales bacterium 17-61-9]|nr:MAG: hypothetical protein B7X93_02815 [Hydrogenophilales bacterium 17-61-9]
MSDSPILSKMDALLKKHRGGGDSLPPVQPEPVAAPATPASSRSTPPANAWLPVLTQVIERGTPPVVAAPIAAPAAAHLPEASSDIPTPDQPFNAAPQAAAAQLLDATLAEQLMSELGPRLSAVMEQQVASELRKNLDQTVATLLSQLDVNVREIVRDAVAEKLKKPHDPSL